MKDENAPQKGGIEPTFFRKPSSRQEGKKLHLECEIEALPRPEIFWFLGDQQIQESEKYSLFRAIQPSNPNIHFVRLTIDVRKKGLIKLRFVIYLFFRNHPQMMGATM